MSKQAMNAEYLRRTFDYSEETGVFTWKESRGCVRKGATAGHKDAIGYVQIHIEGTLYRAHRLAWVYVYGEAPKGSIDHMDGNKSNNSITDLRDVTLSKNMLNQHRAHRNNKSGYLGVCKNGTGWRAEIKLLGKKVNLGTYNTPEEASFAYQEQKKRLLSESDQTTPPDTEGVRRDAERLQHLCNSVRCASANIDGKHGWNFLHGKGWTVGATFREAIDASMDAAIAAQGGVS
jgi:hypothetical protein